MLSPSSRICFAVQTHTDARQCERLVRALCSEGDMVLLHVDRKRPAYRVELLQRLHDVDGDIRVLEESQSVPVYWSGFSAVQATLRCLEAFLHMPNGCQWMSLHSGQDYPLQPIAAYRDYLRTRQPALQMESDAVGAHWWRCQIYNFFRERSFNRRLWARVLDRALREAQKPFVRRHRGVEFRKGSAWFAASREAAACLLEASTPQWQALWRYSAVPDEHYFQTLATKLDIPMLGDRLRYIDFPTGANSPRVLQLRDLAALRQSGALFARKFESAASAELLQQLDQALAQARLPEATHPSLCTRPGPLQVRAAR